MRGCRALKSVVIGDQVTSIGQSSFSGCSRLESVVIGRNVTYIGSFAFDNCNKVTRIELLCETPPAVGYDNFSNLQFTMVDLYIPVNCKSRYKVAFMWEKFAFIYESNEKKTQD